MTSQALDQAHRAFVAGARRATLATIGPDGRPRLVPVCFVLAEASADEGSSGLAVYTPIDEKPKREPDPMALARVRDVLARPAVSLLVDRWDEDWRRLAWVRISGSATILSPGGSEPAGEHATAVAALRAKYPQYRSQALEVRPMIRVSVEGVSSWGAVS